MKKEAFNCYYVDSDPGFDFLKGNRDLNEEHVQKIKQAMLKHQYFPSILVVAHDDGYYIVDGQHRYQAAKELWKDGKSYDLLVEEYSSINPYMDAINFNNSRLSWGLITYLKAWSVYYETIGHENKYAEFLKWIEHKNWNRKITPYRIGLAFLKVGISNLKTGLFKNNISFEEGTRLYNTIANTSCFNTIISCEASVKGFIKVFKEYSYDGVISIIDNFDDAKKPYSSKIYEWQEYYETFI